MSDLCRLCSSPLRGSRRKWLFGGSGSLPILFSHVLNIPLSRSQPGSSHRSRQGKGRPEDAEFLCGKCCHSLSIFHRYDLVLSRMRQLYSQRSALLFSERDKLSLTLRTIHARAWGLPLPDPHERIHPRFSGSCNDINTAGYHNSYYNTLSPGYQNSCPSSPFPDRLSSFHGSLGSLSSGSPTKTYQNLLEKDRSLWEHESWWEDRGVTCQRCAKGDKCHSCSSWRVSDANYDVVCTVPRRRKHSRGDGGQSDISGLLRSKSLGSFGGGSSRGSVLSFSTASLERLSLTGEEEVWEPPSPAMSSPPRSSSPSPVLCEALRNLKTITYSPVKTPTRSKIPVKKIGQSESGHVSRNSRTDEDLRPEKLPEEEEKDTDWDVYMAIGSEVCRTQVSRSLRIKNTLTWLQTQLQTAQNKSTGQEKQDSPTGQEELVRELIRSLNCKEEVLEDCLSLLLNLQLTSDTGEPQTNVNEILRNREQQLKAKEAALAEETRQREAEVERLHKELRDREEDVGRLAKVLRENQATITALRDLLGEKDFTIQQLEIALDSAVRSAASQDSLRVSALREKDSLITAIQSALSSSNQDVEALADSLLSQGLDHLGGSPISESTSNPLLAQLQEKGRLLSQALSDNQQQSVKNQRDIQDLLNALGESQTLLQKQLQHCKDRLQTGAQEQKTLRNALQTKENQLREEKQKYIRDTQQAQTELAQLHGAAQERDQVTQKLLQDAQSRDQTIKRLQERLNPGGMKGTLHGCRLP
ncbi:putative leucine-rich repeat-containing protein DDB_G0290503 [Bombina bombina]|uniref:putative leucine-rich repeat-containing protein DDB_G0290503 n=1 Tax=Bombina bombina TaxID=8345 RepID=UPI00235B2267|nr:putative leucine-rich repeat-containing protein DDB_G0290503 [Bombina bombina]